MTWVNLSSAFGYGTKLTSSNMQQLRDNIAAAFAKDTGAPELATDYIETVMVANANITTVKVKTSVGDYDGNIPAGTGLTVALQDYCFFPSLYCSVVDQIAVFAQAASYTDTIARFRLYNNDSSSRAYEINWRYITASDEPFIFALINKSTGKTEHVWICDDPPPGYWGLNERPVDFIPPVIPDNVDDYEQVTLFKQEQAFLDELRAKKAKDKKPMIEIFNGYEFDKKAQLFKSKNISMI